MDIITMGLGIFLAIFGLIMIWLRWCCDEMVALSWFMFIGGILIAIASYFATPINELI